MANQEQMKVDIKNQQLATKLLKVQLGHLARAQYTRTQRGLSSDIDPNSKQVNAVSTYSGLKLEELEPNKVTHKAATKDADKVKNDKVKSVENKVESVKPLSPYCRG